MLEPWVIYFSTMPRAKATLGTETLISWTNPDGIIDAVIANTRKDPDVGRWPQETLNYAPVIDPIYLFQNWNIMLIHVKR